MNKIAKGFTRFAHPEWNQRCVICIAHFPELLPRFQSMTDLGVIEKDLNVRSVGLHAN